VGIGISDDMLQIEDDEGRVSIDAHAGMVPQESGVREATAEGK
jgi:hypothetical protein